jgi:hypothetical protein
MASVLPPLDTPEERLVFWMISGTWGLWLIGGLYHLFPIFGWVLVGLAVARRIGLADDHGVAPVRVPWGVIAWLIGMATMLVALVIAHLDYELGGQQLLKSIFGWFKGWGLLAAFIFAGSQLRIKPIVVFRANNILAAQSLALTPVLMVCAFAGAPEIVYVSPLYYLGGPGPSFFSVSTHAWDSGTLGFRLFYFAPWSPAAAFCAHIGLVCGIFDTRWRWRVVGIVSALVVCAMSQSRLSLVAVPLLLVGLPLMSSALRAWPAAIAAALLTVGMLLLTQVKDAIDDAIQAFMGARADSSRVRSALARIAYHRWETEAPIFGHGVVERGSHLVEHMMIGSHHTWHGLLFVKGAVGLAALVLPLAWSFFELLAKAQRDAVARAALGMVLVFVFNSFGENLEILAYLAWPGLLVIGIASKRRLLVPEVWASELRPAFKVQPETAHP